MKLINYASTRPSPTYISYVYRAYKFLCVLIFTDFPKIIIFSNQVLKLCVSLTWKESFPYSIFYTISTYCVKFKKECQI